MVTLSKQPLYWFDDIIPLNWVILAALKQNKMKTLYKFVVLFFRRNLVLWIVRILPTVFMAIFHLLEGMTEILGVFFLSLIAKENTKT